MTNRHHQLSVIKRGASNDNFTPLRRKEPPLIFFEHTRKHIIQPNFSPNLLSACKKASIILVLSFLTSLCGLHHALRHPIPSHVLVRSFFYLANQLFKRVILDLHRRYASSHS
ncbi:hypothetical protein Plhal703r1_c24g0102971 [Plasmopara halstedii]